MIRIDENLLQELGVAEGLSDDQKNDAIEDIRNTLNDRVGEKAIDSLSDEQVDQLEKAILGSSAEETAQWLQASVPNYEAMFSEEFEKLKTEISQQGLAVVASPDDTTPAE